MEGSIELRIATCVTLGKPDPDRAPLDSALAAAGVHARWLAWDDPTADWDAPVPTIIRSTWNYPLHRQQFLAWTERATRAAPMYNPPDVLRSNTHKRYLLELALRGVPTVPTHLVERGGTRRVADLGWPRVVVKPAVGGGSRGVRSFDGRDPAADAYVAELSSLEEVLIQPYLDSVQEYGERSLIWIDGELTHAVRKAPRFAGQEESVSGPHPIAEDERAIVTPALARWVDRILYGRIDLARDGAGKPLVMELELTEPSLYFSFAPGSAERYVERLLHRLGGGRKGD